MYSFSAIDRLLLLYFTVVGPKLDYVLRAWNNITAIDASKLERGQRNVAAL
jgi:hypothetical protein